jgi:hypothetical protein
MSLAIAIGVATAHATTLSLNSPFGPGTITRDTTTHLDWLDIWLTEGLSSSDLATLKNGPFSGFRYATSSEVNGFLSPYLIPLTGGPGACGPGGGLSNLFCPLQISPLLDLVNLVYVPSSNPILDPEDLLAPWFPLRALFGPSDSTDLGNQQPGGIDVLALFIYNDVNGIYGEIDAQGINFPITPDSLAGEPYGYFLVKPIPEPSTLSLFCAGIVLCSVALARRRRVRIIKALRQPSQTRTSSA